MGGHRVQALVEHRSTRRQIARALHAGGLSVEFIGALGEIDGAAVAEAPRVLLLELDGRDAVDAAMAHLGSAPPAVVLLSQGSDKQVPSYVLRSAALDHLVAQRRVASGAQPSVEERELLVTCKKILTRDIFGIDKYIDGSGIIVHRHRVTSTKDKLRVLDQFQLYLTALDCHATIQASIVNTADELIRNAIVHAPHRDGKPRYEHLPTCAELTLEPEEQVEVEYGCDGQRLMLSVVDHFGRLTKQTISRYLARSEEPGVTPETKASGAGLGMGMAFRTVHELVVNVEAHRRTEVIVGWSLRISSGAEFRQMEKSINFFQSGAPG